MGTRKTLRIFFSLLAVATFTTAAHMKYVRDENRQCEYCNFYAKTGLSPYELLWTVASEISPALDEEDRQPMLMNPEDLRMAEKFYEAYCEQFCGKVQ